MCVGVCFALFLVVFAERKKKEQEEKAAAKEAARIAKQAESTH